MANEAECRRHALVGCLLGTAVVDAIGLPAEGLSRERQRRRFGEITGHRFLFGRGMLSDDTEHACMVARALVASAGEPAAFARSLARQMRAWTLLLPAATGRATLRAGVRLLVGFPPERSGVPSAGNGPAMRAALLGVVWGHDTGRLRELVRVSTRLTHTDPRAEWGALAVAHAAHLAATRDDVPPEELARSLRSLLAADAGEMLSLVERATESAAGRQSTGEFAAALGLEHGVSGYINHTVPVALHAWLAHPRDCRAAVLAAVHCGGDTDTVAAITGGIVGARVGEEGIPADWLAGLRDWPMSIGWIRALGEQVAGVALSGAPARPLPLPWPAKLLRNTFFLGVVLAHGFRRMVP